MSTIAFFPGPHEGPPPSEEVSMADIEEISRKLGDIRVIVGRLEESNENRTRREIACDRRHDLFESRLVTVERAVSDAKMTVGLFKWLVGTMVATAAVAIAGVGLALKAIYG